MEQILRSAIQELEQGRPAVLAVIAGSQGSTPRRTGAAMLVGRSGVLAGTIGGGELEYWCTQAAFQRENDLLEFSLDNQQAAGLGMVCGGSVQVLFVPLEDRMLLQRALTLTQNLEPGWLLLPLAGGAPELKTEGLPVYAQRVNRVGEEMLSLPLSDPGRIFIMGAGHVALELSKLLDVLGYPYVVADDREEFASSSRYPGVRKVLVGEFDQLDTLLTGHLAPGPMDCICIMTRGHLKDMDALRFALRTPAGYIGLMGSRRKRERIFDQLTKEGFTDAPERIITPIGIPLGGQTPAEVAVSIAAQLVHCRSQKRHDSKLPL